MVVRATAEAPVVEKKASSDSHAPSVDLFVIEVFGLNCRGARSQERKLGPLERGGTLSGDAAAGKASPKMNFFVVGSKEASRGYGWEL